MSLKSDRSDAISAESARTGRVLNAAQLLPPLRKFFPSDFDSVSILPLSSPSLFESIHPPNRTSSNPEALSKSKMDVEALVEAPFAKQNGTENGHSGSPRERCSPRTEVDANRLNRVVSSSSRSHHRSPTPSSEYSRHSSRHRRDHDRHRDREHDKDYYRDESRSRKDNDYSESRSRHRDDRYYDDADRYERRHSDDRYRDDRSDRRRSRYDDDHYEERNSKRRREYDDLETSRSRPVDDRDHREEPPHSSGRDPSPELTEEERDQRTVFVQQLAARLRTKELIKFFEQAGPVREAQIVKDRISGRSKGVGYVEFRNPGSVSEAIAMTGQRLLGIPIIVQLTEAEKNRQARLDLAAAHSGPTKEAPIHRLYIGNIHFNLSEDDIKAVFAPFGEIEQVQLQKEHDSGRSRGYGWIQYRDPPSAREALEKLNGFELAGRPIRVGLGNDKFTNESTQAILDRFDGFRSNFIEPVTRGGSERLGGKGGARAPQSLDDSDVQGVSFQNVSREALMKKLAREEPKEEPPKTKSYVTPPEASRCILLKDCFNPSEETGTAWVKELEEDVKHECENKYGKVSHIHVEEDSEGEIYIKFESVSAGEKAMQGLNGRWFGGRRIAASPISDAVYASKFPRARAL